MRHIFFILFVAGCIAPQGTQSERVQVRDEHMRHMRKFFFSGGVAKSIPNPTPDVPEEPPETTQDVLDRFRAGEAVHVVVIGNSIACGYYATNYANIVEQSNGRISSALYTAGASTINGWVQRLRDYMLGVNPASTFFNYSGDGWNTNNHNDGPVGGEGYVSTRGGTYALIDAQTDVPEIALLPLQINDRTFDTEATFVANTTAIIEALQGRGIHPVIIAENVAGGSSTVTGRAITLAAELDVPLINVFELDWGGLGISVPWYFLPDTTHPNDTGHTQIYNTIKDWFDNATEQP